MESGSKATKQKLKRILAAKYFTTQQQPKENIGDPDSSYSSY